MQARWSAPVLGHFCRGVVVTHLHSSFSITVIIVQLQPSLQTPILYLSDFARCAWRPIVGALSLADLYI